MPLPSSGPLKLSQIRDEFDGTNPVRMSQYYSGGGLVPSGDSNIPASGSISVSDFYGATNTITYTFTSNALNVDAQNLFTSAEWTSNISKEIIIPSSITIGSNSTGLAAFRVPSNARGTVTIINRGEIQGAQGAGGVNGSPNGKNGGVAMSVSAPVRIQNTGAIRGGGGGGGRGTNGTRGSCPQSCREISGNGGCCNGTCSQGSKVGDNCSVNRACFGCNVFCVARCRICSTPSAPSPGAGGNGGTGRGYSNSNVSGSPGQDVNNSCGTTDGGRGGNGGDWGSTGGRGLNYAGSANGGLGGLGGAAVSGGSRVTWIGPRGTTPGGTTG